MLQTTPLLPGQTIHPGFLSSDRSYMRLTEKENETLPIDVSEPCYCYFWENNYKVSDLCFFNSLSLSLFFVFLQIVLQTILSFVMTCYGIVHIAGEFKDMDASSELKNK